MALPQEILDLVEMNSLEDIVLALLRERITTVPVQSQIYDDQTFPAVVIHRGDINGEWMRGDPRFIDYAKLEVFCFVDGINADEEASLLSEAVRVVLRGSTNKIVPGLGYLTKIEMVSPPRNAADWDTATGPVQYADLPAEVVRYVTTYTLSIRKPD